MKEDTDNPFLDRLELRVQHALLMIVGRGAEFLVVAQAEKDAERKLERRRQLYVRTACWVIFLTISALIIESYRETGHLTWQDGSLFVLWFTVLGALIHPRLNT
jgi:hypothetical protein